MAQQSPALRNRSKFNNVNFGDLTPILNDLETLFGVDSASAFDDSLFNIYDNSDNTKKVVFQVSGVTTATTRTLTIPNASGTIALTSGVEVPLTFSTGLTRTTNTITSNLSTGIAGGQSVKGGTVASENLTLTSTAHATKGKILFGTSAYDEVNNRLGIGTDSPDSTAVFKGAGATNATYVFKATDSADVVNFSLRDNGEVNSRLGYWMGGTKALFFGSTSTTNLFCGDSCGNITQTANNNTGYGANNLNLLTSGLQNSAFGSSAVFVVTAGNNNSGFGFEALKLTTGSDNDAHGSSAGAGNTTGQRNLFLGGSSGAGSVTSSDNIFIGYFTSLSADTWTSSMAIGKLSVITASNQVVWGSPTNQYTSHVYGQGSVGVAENTSLVATRFTVTGIAAGNTDKAATNGTIYWDGAASTGDEIGGSHIWRVTPAGATGSTVNTLVSIFEIKGSGIPNLLLQTGNAGLVTGDLYADTAANILANSDLIVARKV